MFITNRSFALSLFVVALQQLILAASTWNIALAGASVAAGDLSKAKAAILAFFGLALLAYIISSASELLSIKAQNQIWHTYLKDSIQKFSEDISLSSEKNRRALNQWISAEALATIQTAVPFYINMVSTLLNIALTLSVFFISLGALMGSAVGGALVISLGLVLLVKSKIKALASGVQNHKALALTGIEPLITNKLFGNRSMATAEEARFHPKILSFFSHNEQYSRIEQLVACAPIIVSVAIVFCSIYFSGSTSLAELGILVALLPRSLQLFGSIHSLSMYLSHFVLINQKIRNLATFTKHLESRDLERQLSPEKIDIRDTRTSEAYTVAQLLETIHATPDASGRILIVGDNGAGKSTLLKIIKSQNENSILVTPGARFSETASLLSTGQAQALEFEALRNISAKIFLLDEWDANLDENNKKIINAMIEKLSESSLIIEVRHGAGSQF